MCSAKDKSPEGQIAACNFYRFGIGLSSPAVSPRSYS